MNQAGGYLYWMELDTPIVHLQIRDHILVGTYKKNVRIDLEAAREIVRVRKSFTRGKKMAAMIISQGVISMDKPAREYLASEEATEGLAATAIIVTSPFSRLLGNFFMSVNKPRMAVRMFSDIPRAGKWLRQFITDD